MSGGGSFNKATSVVTRLEKAYGAVLKSPNKSCYGLPNHYIRWRCTQTAAATMPSNTHTTETIRDFYEATGETFNDLLDDILADDIVVHDPHLEDIHGNDRVEDYYGSFHDAFSDIAFTVDDLFMTGDRVAVRWTAEGTHKANFWGIEPTGSEMHLSGIDIVRVTDDQMRMSEVWTVYDSATLLQQLDVELPVIPPTGEA